MCSGFTWNLVLRHLQMYTCKIMLKLNSQANQLEALDFFFVFITSTKGEWYLWASFSTALLIKAK